MQPSTNTVVLNFEAADLREVVRNILGDILNESYTIDSAVGGQVTIRTTRGIAREVLPETLEMLLRMNGATMIREDGIYKIVPQANAARGNVTPQLGNARRPLPPGFSVQIVPLKYVGAPEMLKLLEPFAKDAQAIRIDPTRNLLILSGTEAELRHLIDDGRIDRRALHEVDHRRQRVRLDRGAIVRADIDVDADDPARDRFLAVQHFAVAHRGEDAGREDK